MQKFLHSIFGKPCLHGARFCAQGHCDIGMGFQWRPSVQFTLFMRKFWESPRVGVMVRCLAVQICTAHHTANKCLPLANSYSQCLLFWPFIFPLFHFTIFLKFLWSHDLNVLNSIFYLRTQDTLCLINTAVLHNAVTFFLVLSPVERWSEEAAPRASGQDHCSEWETGTKGSFHNG